MKVSIVWYDVKEKDVKKVKEILDKMVCDFVDGGGLDDMEVGEMEFDLCDNDVIVEKD